MLDLKYEPQKLPSGRGCDGWKIKHNARKAMVNHPPKNQTFILQLPFIDIYSWFARQKWWFSLVMLCYVSLPEGTLGKPNRSGPKLLHVRNVQGLHSSVPLLEAARRQHGYSLVKHGNWTFMNIPYVYIHIIRGWILVGNFEDVHKAHSFLTCKVANMVASSVLYLHVWLWLWSSWCWWPDHVGNDELIFLLDNGTNGTWFAVHPTDRDEPQ